LVLFGCAESSAPPLPVNIIDLTDGGLGNSCIQPSFPSEQPDLSIIAPPIFLLTTSQAQQSSTGQAQVRPGDPIGAEIFVNSATRNVTMELTDAWDPTRVVAREEMETAGNETLELLFFPTVQNRGRYYMKLTLCGSDCNEREVLFDINECPPQPKPENPCGINMPYRRTVFEGGELLQSDPTCIDLGSTPSVGSGTILIQ
jgi:hypothetical protein